MKYHRSSLWLSIGLLALALAPAAGGRTYEFECDANTGKIIEDDEREIYQIGQE